MSISFEDFEFDTGTCVPIQVVVLVFLIFYSGIQIDSNRIIKEFLIICALDIERIKLIKIRSSEFIHVFWIYMLHSFTASDRLMLQVSSLSEICIASWTTKSVEECIDVVYSTIVTVISQQLNTLLVLFDASSCKCPNHCAVIKVDRSMSNMKILIPTISSTDEISSIKLLRTFKGQGLYC